MFIKAVVPHRCVAKDFGKNYLETSNFAVFVREIRRERKSVSLGGNFFLRLS